VARVGAECRDPDRDRPQYALRKAFLLKIEELAPQVPKDLLQALPIYREAASKGEVPLTWDALLLKKGRRANKLRNAVSAWGRQHNLTDDWLLDEALRTLRQRQDEADQKAQLLKEMTKKEAAWLRQRQSVPAKKGIARETPELSVFANPRFVDIARLTAFRFEHKVGISDDNGWVPAWLTWAEYESTTTKSLNREVRQLRLKWRIAMRQYRRAREQEATLHGQSPAQVRREVERHLEWLVRWQVLKQNRPEIAHACDMLYRKRADTIRDAIKSMARDLGLKNLRKGSAGRPPA
jgi:hypothetical protein